jgi:hypothetical protein
MGGVSPIVHDHRPQTPLVQVLPADVIRGGDRGGYKLAGKHSMSAFDRLLEHLRFNEGGVLTLIHPRPLFTRSD